MLDHLLHLIGCCPDHMFHPNLLGAMSIMVAWLLGRNCAGRNCAGQIVATAAVKTTDIDKL